MNHQCKHCGQQKIQLGHSDPDFDYYCPDCNWEAIEEAEQDFTEQEKLRCEEAGLPIE